VQQSTGSLGGISRPNGYAAVQNSYTPAPAAGRSAQVRSQRVGVRARTAGPHAACATKRPGRPAGRRTKSAGRPPWAWATALIQKDECRQQLRNPAAPNARSGPGRARRKLRNVSMQLFN
jgi:hypothetical protein